MTVQSMQTRQTKYRTTPVTRLVRLVAALSIVLGIFGMHALSHHGTTHEPAPTTTTAVTAAGLAAETGAMTMAAGMAHDPDSHGTSTGSTGDPGHSLGDMVMLCVAILVAAAAGLLGILGLLRRVPRVWAVLLPTITARVSRQLPPRGAGPPPVWEFSVIRC